jgi:monofunctional biosynthetic peptidoglycan transglycosylase
MTESTPARPRARRARPLRVVLTVALVVAFVLMLLPLVLVPLYRYVSPVSTLMLARWASGRHVERTWVPLNRFAPILPRSVLAAEDARFCFHHGVDWRAMETALAEADNDIGEARGGSTITQQTAKNLFLWPGRSIVRKALELPLALWIDLVLPKRRIMEIYLNVAEWGPTGQFGAEAGARSAFGKSAGDLDPREAALMAAILPNPVRRSARRPGPGVRRLAGIYEARAQDEATSAGCLGLRPLASGGMILYKPGLPRIPPPAR